MERHRPFSARSVNPQEHQIGSLRIGEDAVDDPAIGVEISAGECQKRRNGQTFLVLDIQVSR